MAAPPHNLPQIQLGRQLGTWKPFTDFRSALEAGNIAEALRLN